MTRFILFLCMLLYSSSDVSTILVNSSSEVTSSYSFTSWGGSEREGEREGREGGGRVEGGRREGGGRRDGKYSTRVCVHMYTHTYRIRLHIVPEHE